MPIHVLSPELASQIAAGEVIERPASVVKELMENALDAGANQIRIEVTEGGRDLIRLSDDGIGIPAAEVQLAFERHATSKINCVDDLANVSTLGFRGEALASIASVAQVTCITRSRDEALGVQLRLQGGQALDHKPVGAPAGTQISVEHLFYNVPARLKFLKAVATERRHIDTLVTRYAMAYPGVRFHLVHDGRITFQTHGSGDLRDVLIAVYGVETAQHMMDLSSVAGPPTPYMVAGYVSSPALTRANRNELTFFVNGRWVQDRSIAYAVVQAYHTMLQVNRYPICILRVDLPPEDVDVNVHPAKSEVRFRDNDAVFRSVQKTVRQALIGPGDSRPHLAGRPTPLRTSWEETTAVEATAAEATAAEAAGGDTSGAEASGDETSWAESDRSGHGPAQDRSEQAAGEPENRRPEAERQRFERQLWLRGLGLRSPLPETALEPEQSQAGEVQSARPSFQAPPGPAAPPGSARSTLPPLRVLGQINATYIVAEGPAGLYLIDQHAAHERVLYERFMAELGASQLAVQALLNPLTVELTPTAAGLVEEHADSLQQVGFELESFGGNTYLLRSAPVILAQTDLREALNDLLAELDAGEMPLASSQEARLVRRVCKRAAIKAGQVLAAAEMQGLIRQLEGCSAPHTCPHGRPTLIHLSSEHLAREFGRH